MNPHFEPNIILKNHSGQVMKKLVCVCNTKRVTFHQIYKK